MPFYLPDGRRNPVQFDTLTVTEVLAVLGRVRAVLPVPDDRIMVIRRTEGRYGHLIAAAAIRFELGQTNDGLPVYTYLCVVDGQFDICQKIGDGQLPSDVAQITQSDIDDLFPAAPAEAVVQVEAAFIRYAADLRDMTPEELVAQLRADAHSAKLDDGQLAQAERLLLALGTDPTPPEQRAAIDGLLAIARDEDHWLAGQADLLEWPDSYIRWFAWPDQLLERLKPVAPLALVEGRDDNVTVATALRAVVGRLLTLPPRDAVVEELESSYDQSTVHLRDAQALVAPEGISLVKVYNFGDHDLIGRVRTDDLPELERIGQEVRCPIQRIA